MDLLPADVQPGAGISEVRPFVVVFEAKHAAVKSESLAGVGNDDAGVQNVNEIIHVAKP